jgi:hypothetical protein
MARVCIGQVVGSHTTSLDHTLAGTIHLSYADTCTQHTPELVFEKYAAQKGQMRIAAADCSRVHALHFKAHVRNNQSHPTVKTKRTAANHSNSPQPFSQSGAQAAIYQHDRAIHQQRRPTVKLTEAKQARQSSNTQPKESNKLHASRHATHTTAQSKNGTLACTACFLETT